MLLCWFVDKCIQANGLKRNYDVLRKNANTKHVSKLNHYNQMNLIHPWAFNFLFAGILRIAFEGRRMNECVCGWLLISILHSNNHQCLFHLMFHLNSRVSSFLTYIRCREYADGQHTESGWIKWKGINLKG